jgi:DNA polymerase
VVFGVGNPAADLLVIGEAPGRDEDLQAEPFVGRSGKLLDRLLEEEMGINRTICYIANVVKCRPPDNRNPQVIEIETCRPYLESQIELISPKVILTLGNFSSQLLLDTKDGITKLRGTSYRYKTRDLVPTFHPAAALRQGGETVAKMRADFVRAKRLLAKTPK